MTSIGVSVSIRLFWVCPHCLCTVACSSIASHNSLQILRFAMEAAEGSVVELVFECKKSGDVTSCTTLSGKELAYRIPEGEGELENGKCNWLIDNVLITTELKIGQRLVLTNGITIIGEYLQEQVSEISVRCNPGVTSD